jgi:hypothetical protein
MQISSRNNDLGADYTSPMEHLALGHLWTPWGYQTDGDIPSELEHAIRADIQQLVSLNSQSIEFSVKYSCKASVTDRIQ